MTDIQIIKRTLRAVADVADAPAPSPKSSEDLLHEAIPKLEEVVQLLRSSEDLMLREFFADHLESQVIDYMWQDLAHREIEELTETD